MLLLPTHNCNLKPYTAFTEDIKCEIAKSVTVSNNQHIAGYIAFQCLS